MSYSQEQIEIQIVDNADLFKQFIELPWQIYEKNSLWVPPLKKQDAELLDQKKHPFWQNATRQLFLAKKADQFVGRIAAIDSKIAHKPHNADCGIFGFFECCNEQNVANALLDATASWLKERGKRAMHGPFNPSTNYTCGLLVDGFALPPALLMPWNPEYYPVVLEKWHLHKEQDLFAYTIDKDHFQIATWLEEELVRIKESENFTCRSTTKATLDSDIAIMLDLYAQSWSNNWGFMPISPDEAKLEIKELGQYLNPDFFVLFWHGEEPIAGMVALPDYNPLLKSLNGSIGLLSPWHWLENRKKIHEQYRILLFGIKPEYQMRGLPLLLLDYFMQKAKINPSLQRVEGSWILESNNLMNGLIEDFSGQLTKRYRIYYRNI